MNTHHRAKPQMQPGMKSNRGSAALSAVPLAAICALTGLIPACADAQSTTDPWQWRATVYVWLPSLDSETSFPTGNDGPSIEVSGDAILDSLNFAFMGAFEGRKGRWGVATDVIYLDLGASKSATRDFSIGRVELPASVNGDLRLDITGWLWSVEGSYELVGQDRFSMNVLAGARMLDLQEDLGWKLNGDISSLPLPGRSGSSRAEVTQWDAIVGLKGRASLGREQSWYVPYRFDVGAGDSNVTWQALAGLGYSFESVEVMAVWRYLDYELPDDSPIKSLSLNGPAFGVTFRF